ncbi:MAG: response regulator [Candidatus Hydrogenedentes bacterium]|nr:response regulator [Candidatus Hydrogenedentota bacterium]
MGTVLLVDDDATVRSTLAAYLEDDGLDVATAASGEEAVRAVRQGLRPAVCIMDMRLPGMDGHDAILALHECLPVLAFLIHTGSLSYGLSDDLLGLGITDKQMFRKPLPDMGVLADAIRALLIQKEEENA